MQPTTLNGLDHFQLPFRRGSIDLRLDEVFLLFEQDILLTMVCHTTTRHDASMNNILLQLLHCLPFNRWYLLRGIDLVYHSIEQSRGWLQWLGGETTFQEGHFFCDHDLLGCRLPNTPGWMDLRQEQVYPVLDWKKRNESAVDSLVPSSASNRRMLELNDGQWHPRSAFVSCIPVHYVIAVGSLGRMHERSTTTTSIRKNSRHWALIGMTSAVQTERSYAVRVLISVQSECDAVRS